jgi:hypothetical protein
MELKTGQQLCGPHKERLQSQFFSTDHVQDIHARQEIKVCAVDGCSNKPKWILTSYEPHTVETEEAKVPKAPAVAVSSAPLNEEEEESESEWGGGEAIP